MWIRYFGVFIGVGLLLAVVSCQRSDSTRSPQTVSAPTAQQLPASAPQKAALPLPSLNIAEIPEFALTNEFGNPVSLRQFKGQALGLTFFFTRCPLPEFCPRLSRSFAETSQKLAAMSSGPTNWHLLSVSFDPMDTPEVLRAYARQYHYDSNHWSFVTGDPAHIRALTHGFGLSTTPDSGVFAHDFRTAVFNSRGQLQALWPFGGDMSAMLAEELIKGAAAQDRPDRFSAASALGLAGTPP